MATSRSSDGPSIYRDLRRPVASGIIWKKGSREEIPSLMSSDKSMGEDLDRSKYTRVFSSSEQSKSVHKEDRDTKTSLQAWHTWVRAIMS